MNTVHLPEPSVKHLSFQGGSREDRDTCLAAQPDQALGLAVPATQVIGVNGACGPNRVRVRGQDSRGGSVSIAKTRGFFSCFMDTLRFRETK